VCAQAIVFHTYKEVRACIPPSLGGAVRDQSMRFVRQREALTKPRLAQVHTRKVMKALMAERRSLLTAFLVLQDSGAPLEFGTWRELIRKIRPAASDTEAKVLFDFLDVDHHGSITIHEFLRLIEVLSFQVRARTRQIFIKVACMPSQLTMAFPCASLQVYCVTIPAVITSPSEGWQARATQYIQGPLRLQMTELIKTSAFDWTDRIFTAVNAAAVVLLACPVSRSWHVVRSPSLATIPAPPMCVPAVTIALSRHLEPP
jgi:hypothetical protein